MLRYSKIIAIVLYTVLAIEWYPLFQQAQQRLATYEQAETLLEECVDHTTVGERLLVEYYLTLEELVQDSLQAGENESSACLQVLFDVQVVAQ